MSLPARMPVEVMGPKQVATRRRCVSARIGRLTLSGSIVISVLSMVCGSCGWEWMEGCHEAIEFKRGQECKIQGSGMVGVLLTEKALGCPGHLDGLLDGRACAFAEDGGQENFATIDLVDCGFCCASQGSQCIK